MAAISLNFVTEGISGSLLNMMQNFYALSIAAVMFTIGPALAAKDPSMVDTDPYIVQNAWTDPDECNADTARPFEFEELTSGYSELLGECVRVDGYMQGRAIFSSASLANTNKSNVSDRLKTERVGVYADWDAVGDPPIEARLMRIIGRVGQCETQWPNAIMVLGYCHYTGGPVILAASVTPIPSRN